jgi:subtilisin family serine protease
MLAKRDKWLVWVMILLPAWDMVSAGESTILLRTRERPQGLYKSAAGAARTGVASIDALLEPFAPDAIRTLADLPNNAGLRKGGSVDPVFRWLAIDLPSAINPDEVVQRLSACEEVEVVQRNRAFHLHFVPNDTYVAKQWALSRIQAFKAWDVQRGKSNVLVAVIDSGIDYNHPDLAQNIYFNPGEDFNANGRIDEADFNGIDDDGNGYIDDVRGWDFADAPIIRPPAITWFVITIRWMKWGMARL